MGAIGGVLSKGIGDIGNKTAASGASSAQIATAKSGERIFQVMKNNKPIFRLDNHVRKGLHYHRWPNMKYHRPKEGGF